MNVGWRGQPAYLALTDGSLPHQGDLEVPTANCSGGAERGFLVFWKSEAKDDTAPVQKLHSLTGIANP